MAHSSRLNYQPVIVIGAARSGTRLVRDLIASHPEIEKIPYDINYVWRLGNEKLTHDEIPVENVSNDIVLKIRDYFGRYHFDAPLLIEKTVSNCLRVPVVDKVFPNARYIHLYRNGWDVIESSYRQWIATPDLRYILTKARSYPLFQAFGYASTYAFRLLRKFISSQNGSVSPWGPEYDGIYNDLRNKPILEVCAIQWSRCVNSALGGLVNLPEDRVYHLGYEEFIRNTQVKLTSIADFLCINPRPYIDRGTAQVTSGNIGKGLKSLSDNQKIMIINYVDNTMDILEKINHT